MYNIKLFQQGYEKTPRRQKFDDHDFWKDTSAKKKKKDFSKQRETKRGEQK